MYGWDRSHAAQVGAIKLLTNAAGKTIIKAPKSNSTGTPNSITQVTNKNGGISRDYYNSKGEWVKQISNNDHGNPKEHSYGNNGEHAYDISWNETTKQFDRPIRDLTDSERKENADIL